MMPPTSPRPASQRSNATAIAPTAAPRSSQAEHGADAIRMGRGHLGGGHVDAAAVALRAEVDGHARADRPRAEDRPR